MDPFMLMFAIGWGFAFFVAGTFAGSIYTRITSNREQEFDWQAWANGRWKEAETLLEHLLEVSQGTATALSSHSERLESAVEHLSETVAQRDGEEVATGEAVAERTQRLEQRLEKILEVLEEESRHAPADRDASSDNVPPSSEKQVRERLEGANGDPKHLGRRQPRVAFNETHEVAPVTAGGDLPKRQDFLSVHCRDISSAGFSFYFPSELPWKAIVLRTCHHGTVREITADVVHCSRTAKPTAPAPYVIGCRFTGPLKRSGQSAGSTQGAEKPDRAGTAVGF